MNLSDLLISLSTFTCTRNSSICKILHIVLQLFHVAHNCLTCFSNVLPYTHDNHNMFSNQFIMLLTVHIFTNPTVISYPGGMTYNHSVYATHCWAMLQSYTDMNMDESYMLETMHAHTPNTACTHSTHICTLQIYLCKKTALMYTQTHTLTLM